MLVAEDFNPDDELTPEEIEELKYWEDRHRFDGYSVCLVDRAEMLGDHLAVAQKLAPDSVKLAFIEYADDGVYEGDLFLRDARSVHLPDNLTVTGELDLIEVPLESLPKNLKVLGDASFSLSYLSCLPETLNVMGDVDLVMVRSDMLTIPDGFIFNANLEIWFTKVNWGRGVVVCGDLHIDADGVVPSWVDVCGDVVRV